MKIGRGNRSTRRKPVPAPLCPPQIPLDQTRNRTRAAAVGRRKDLRTEATHEHQAATRTVSFGQMDDAPNRGARITQF
jgi:hypothetical protein